MRLEIQELRLPLAQFALEIDAEFTAARTGIFGPSGAGKTSLLEVIAGLRQPARGRVLFDGNLFSDAETGFALPVRRRKIGYVPQDDSLFPHLSVRRNLLYGHDAKMRGRALSLDRVIEFLKIKSLLERDVRSLSRGENQRVVIARAMLSSPRVLLLDEPLTGLDAELKGAILEQLRVLPNEFGIPMLYVTHDAAEATKICDEIIRVESGKIIARGKPVDVL